MRPTPDKIREALGYDPDTGILTWRPKAVRDKPYAFADVTFNAHYAGKPAGTKNPEGYLRTSLYSLVGTNRRFLNHILAWVHFYGWWPEGCLDHINGDRADNRIANLRAATKAQNSANARVRKNTKSGVKGVHWREDTKIWRVYLKKDGVCINLGQFTDLQEAITARRRAATKLFGEFCNEDEKDVG